MSKVIQINGRAVPVRGDDIDTDRIIPARFLKEITFTRMGDYPFFDERFDDNGNQKPHPFNEEKYQGARILLGNVNFGCGSSREHAPQSLHRWGISAIVAESFAEIFAGNCVMLGVPAVTADKNDVLSMQKTALNDPAAIFDLDLESMQVSITESGGARQKFNISMPESRRKALLEGTWDSTTLLIANADKVRQTASQLPYMDWQTQAE